MVPFSEIVCTGVGVVSPIGIGREAFWQSLIDGCSGVGRMTRFDLPHSIAGEVRGFDPKKFVRPRKSLKVMSRDIQLAYAAADLARQDANIASESIEPERMGIVFGADLIPADLNELVSAYLPCIDDGRFTFDRWGSHAMGELHPLWMLKYLPNMPACHIGIAQDARGPNNSIVHGEVSSLLALSEAVRVIQRGQADVMIAGGTGSRVRPGLWTRNGMFELSGRVDDPAAAMRPFDADRDGMVHGEGAGAFLLETRQHAEARGATVYARILGFSATYSPPSSGKEPEGTAIGTSIDAALNNASLEPADVGHVNARGLSTRGDDQREAQAIADRLGDVPVTAPKSYFGNLGAGTGAVEAAASVLALHHGLLPPTLNFHRPDPLCPVNVVHGEPVTVSVPTALLLSQSPTGQAAAMAIASP